MEERNENREEIFRLISNQCLDNFREYSAKILSGSANNFNQQYNNSYQHMRNLNVHLNGLVTFPYIDIIYFFIDIVYELVFIKE